METLHKLEDTIEGWLKPLPHLPEDWRKWIANNSWWITLIGVIISAFGILGLAYALMIAISFFGAVSSFLTYQTGATYSS